MCPFKTPTSSFLCIWSTFQNPSRCFMSWALCEVDDRWHGCVITGVVRCPTVREGAVLHRLHTLILTHSTCRQNLWWYLALSQRKVNVVKRVGLVVRLSECVRARSGVQSKHIYHRADTFLLLQFLLKVINSADTDRLTKTKKYTNNDFERSVGILSSK